MKSIEINSRTSIDLADRLYLILLHFVYVVILYMTSESQHDGNLISKTNCISYQLFSLGLMSVFHRFTIFIINENISKKIKLTMFLVITNRDIALDFGIASYKWFTGIYSNIVKRI
jgi:hypothetical protein